MIIFCNGKDTVITCPYLSTFEESSTFLHNLEFFILLLSRKWKMDYYTRKQNVLIPYRVLVEKLHFV